MIAPILVRRNMAGYTLAPSVRTVEIAIVTDVNLNPAIDYRHTRL